MSRLTRDGTRLNPSRETKFSGTHGDGGIFIFPVQLTTSRIGNLTRLIHTLRYLMTLHTYMVANPARVQLDISISRSPFVPEDLVSRDGFGCPVLR